MLPTSAGVEPATSWSPVGRRIQLSHRGRPGNVGHFLSSPREREKRDSRRDERDGQARKRNRNESEETEEMKTFPLYPNLLQGQALPNCKPISVGNPSDIRYMTPLPHPPTMNSSCICLRSHPGLSIYNIQSILSNDSGNWQALIRLYIHAVWSGPLLSIHALKAHFCLALLKQDDNLDLLWLLWLF